jgi:hypothetical protein
MSIPLFCLSFGNMPLPNFYQRPGELSRIKARKPTEEKRRKKGEKGIILD